MKLHNYLYGFAGTLLFLTFGHLVVLYKYFQVLLHHGLYYCQEIVKSLNYQIPGLYGRILAGVLVLAAAITLFKLLGSIMRVFTFRRLLQKTKTVESNNLTGLIETLDLQGKVHVFREAKPRAFCFGIRNPKIYISTALVQLMNQHELAIILRHEKYHLEHRDTLTLLLASVIESLFPFFPVISDFIRVYRTDREVKADNAAIPVSGDKLVLKNVLKKLIQYEPSIHPVFLPAMMNADTLEARIRSINVMDATYKKIEFKGLFLSVISFAILLGLMITPVNAVELHEDGQDVVMLCNGSVACESVCRNQTLQLLQSHRSLYTPADAKNFSSMQ